MVPPDQPSLTVSPSPAGRSDEGSASALPKVVSCWDESNIKRFDMKYIVMSKSDFSLLWMQSI